jgi:hypothetical protein
VKELQDYLCDLLNPTTEYLATVYKSFKTPARVNNGGGVLDMEELLQYGIDIFPNIDKAFFEHYTMLYEKGKIIPYTRSLYHTVDRVVAVKETLCAKDATPCMAHEVTHSFLKQTTLTFTGEIPSMMAEYDTQDLMNKDGVKTNEVDIAFCKHISDDYPKKAELIKHPSAILFANPWSHYIGAVVSPFLKENEVPFKEYIKINDGNATVKLKSWGANGYTVMNAFKKYCKEKDIL